MPTLMPQTESSGRKIAGRGELAEDEGPQASDRVLASSEAIGLALVDIAGFDRRIWDRWEGLRARGIAHRVQVRMHHQYLF
jgi:hypothetical protein